MDGLLRTGFMPWWPRRTRSVRTVCRLPGVLVGFSLLAGPSTPAIADPAAQQRREARGWLQLERDQTHYRERLGPLPPAQALELDQVERRQALDLRQIQQRQQRVRREADQRERSTPVASPPPLPGADLAPREDTRQRLDLRIEQETLSPRGR